MLLYQIVDALDKNKIKYAVVGGYALALHGIVRATVDIDLVISLNLEAFEQTEKALKFIGLDSRLPLRAQDLIKMRREYIKNRNLIAWSFVDYKDPLRQVDILLTTDLKSIEVEKISVGGRKISIISLKDLLRMKEIAARPQDLVDIQHIKERLHGEKK